MPKNNTLFIAIISVFVVFALVLYAFPSLFIFLFSNILGNLLLFAAVLGVGYFDVRWGVGLAAIFVILYQAYSLSRSRGNLKEGFTAWSDELRTQFEEYEKTNNPNFQFDINIIQKQASPEEVEYLFENNKWPWSDEVKTLYKNALMTNNILSIDPSVGLDMAQAIYNETAAKELLAWNSKEGLFLLTGATIGHTEGLPDDVNNIVRCGIDASGNGGAVMQKIVNVGYDGINGAMIKNVTTVPDADIPTLVPGFTFLKGDCNPCVALDDPANYSCPFSLNVGDGGGVSDIWKDLWGLTTTSDTSSSSSSSNTSSSSTTDVSNNQFPLLVQLKDELNKATVIINPTTTKEVVSQNESAINADTTNEDVSVESPYLNSNM
jgi:hypothetical protein